jgi:hypothetical protein
LEKEVRRLEEKRREEQEIAKTAAAAEVVREQQRQQQKREGGWRQKLRGVRSSFIAGVTHSHDHATLHPPEASGSTGGGVPSSPSPLPALPSSSFTVVLHKGKGGLGMALADDAAGRARVKGFLKISGGMAGPAEVCVDRVVI